MYPYLLFFRYMNAKAILELISSDLLQQLAIESGVNKYSKKLQGEIVFKLLVYCLVTHKDTSLRRMESAYESVGFALLNGYLQNKKVKYNSISARLNTMSSSYFRELYIDCIDRYTPLLEKQSCSKPFVRFDSTIVSLSSKILKEGYQLKGTAALHRQLKFTIGFDTIPRVADLYTEQKYTSENIALKESIFTTNCIKGKPIHIFDRGITARKTYDELIVQKTPFITRINPKSKRVELTLNRLNAKIKTNTLQIEKDSIVRLFSQRGERTQVLRCIQGIRIDNNEPLHFITNIFDLEVEEVTELYKRRWDIEVFFKFLKQELNFSHILNRSKNGIEIMLYTTMIVAILILVYKSTNRLNGYKITKQRFAQELEALLLLDFVRLTNGDINMATKLLNMNSS